jgi:hypothetical protein
MAAAAAPARPVALVQSPLDRRDYRRLTLENGLDVLLIHDPEMADTLDEEEEVEEEEDEDDEGDEEDDMEEGEQEDAVRLAAVACCRDAGTCVAAASGVLRSGRGGSRGRGEGRQEGARGCTGAPSGKSCLHQRCSPHRSPVLQAAAAVSVGVGSFCDPDDVQARRLPQVTLEWCV